MAYKRALWSSGYTYQVSCPSCGAVKLYTDRELDFRPWFPDGFIYCPRCRKPIRHNEFYAIQPDGSPVYNDRAEASMSNREGYYNTLGGNQPQQPVQYPPQQPVQYPPQQPMPYAQPQPAEAAQPQQTEQPAQTPPTGQAFCPNCGRPYVYGTDHFCAGCGNRLG